MIRLGIRLAVGGGRESWLRLGAIAGGVAIGVAMLLFMISGLQVIGGTLDQPCWRCTGQTLSAGSKDPNVDPLHWEWQPIIYSGKTINTYNVAQTGSRSPQIPGIDRLPGPGEYYASPALAALLDKTPNNQLDDRFPSTLAGQIGRAGLDGPKDLVAVIGHTPAEMPLTPIDEDGLPTGTNGFTYEVWKINDQPQERSEGPLLKAMFVVGVAGLLVSVITLIATATRLSASRREEKFAALRLFGATPKQINQLAAIDAMVSAAVGAVLGLGLFYLLRSLFTIGVTSNNVVAFFPEDLNPGAVGVAGILIATPLLAAVAALVSLRRVRISPLGVVRKAVPKPPRAWTLLPLLAGIIIMLTVWFLNRDVTDTVSRGELVPYFMVGFVALLIGMVMSGSWLTMILARLMAGRARSASGLLAFRRLADNPRAAFRAVNVLVVAAFLYTLFAAFTPFILNTAASGFYSQESESHTIIDQYYTGFDGGSGLDLATLQPGLNDLAAIPGVEPVVGYSPSETPVESYETMLIRCDDMPRLREAACEPGKTTVELSIGFGGVFGIPVSESAPKQIAMPSTELQQRRVLKLLIGVTGGQTTVDRVRTVMSQHPTIFGGMHFMTRDELLQQDREIVTNIRYTLNGVLLIILFIAACSLVVGVGGGLIERKRPFGLLRVTGTSLWQLRRVVLTESIVPLLAAVIAAVGAGFGVAVLLVETFAAKQDPSVRALPGDFYVAMGIGFGVAVLAMLAILPLLAAITKPDQSRFE